VARCRSASERRVRWVVRTLIGLLILPITIADVVFDSLLMVNSLVARPLEDVVLDVSALPDRIARLVADRTGRDVDLEKVKRGEVDFFRLVYHYCVERARRHLPKMQNYVALYGFCRTMALGWVLLFWLVVYAGVARRLSCQQAAAWAAVSALFAYLFYLDFLKFFRRFSVEVLMAFVSIWRCKPSDAAPATK